MAEKVECYGCLIEEPEDECKIEFYLSVEPKLYCADCQITLGEIYGEAWTYEEDIMKGPDTKPVIGAAIPTNNAAPTPPPAPTTYVPPKPLCKHHLTPFTFNTDVEDDKSTILTEYTVYLTGSSNTDTDAQAPWPDAGVYLSSGWFTGMAATTDGVGLGDVTQWPSAFVSWPDRGVIETDVLMPVLKWAADKVTEGLALEIACVGGHGRTGTFTVALMIYLGWEAQEAFEWLRSEYCSKAVESRVQAELLLKVAKLCR